MKIKLKKITKAKEENRLLVNRTLLKLIISEGPTCVAIDATLRGKKIVSIIFKWNTKEYNSGNKKVINKDIKTDL